MPERDTRTSNLTVRVWFDPVCPWTWRTTRWLLEIAPDRDLDLRWHLMSLAALGEAAGRGPDDEATGAQMRAHLRDSRAATRVFAAATRDRGEQILEPLYRAFGTRMHGRHEPREEALVEALHDVELPDSLTDAADEPGQDSAVRASHDQAQYRVGTQAGSPVVGIEGTRAFFGPVLTVVPAGEEAQRLWDGLALLAGVSPFAEVKRGRG